MKKLPVLIPLFVLALAIAGCNPQPDRPGEQSLFASDIRKAYLRYYGNYYAEEGLPQKVYALDCYSDGLLLNKQGHIEGTGTNLYISDIFVPDSVKGLPAGTYTADTTGLPFTFLPGVSYESQITGAYLLHIEEDILDAIAILPKGVLTVEYQGDEAIIHFEGTTSQKKPFHADFSGNLVREDKTGNDKIKLLPAGFPD